MLKRIEWDIFSCAYGGASPCFWFSIGLHKYGIVGGGRWFAHCFCGGGNGWFAHWHCVVVVEYLLGKVFEALRHGSKRSVWIERADFNISRFVQAEVYLAATYENVMS